MTLAVILQVFLFIPPGNVVVRETRRTDGMPRVGDVPSVKAVQWSPREWEWEALRQIWCAGCTPQQVSFWVRNASLN